MSVGKKIFYALLVFTFTMTLFLTLFELLLYVLHKPLSYTISDSHTHFLTWTYLLKQQYMSFIDLNIYTIDEKRHLLDVKRVLEATFKLWMTLVGLSIIIAVLLKNYYRIFFKRVAILGLSINFILLLSSMSFVNSFIFLHTLFFSSQTWIFSNNSKLIELFPLIYFQQFFFLLLIGSMILFTSLFFLSNSRQSKSTS